jgi:hypothetical protein
MPFGSLGVRPQPIVEQQIPNYAQWDWDFAGKAQKSMESTHKMTQDAQNQPLLREKQSIENQIERALFEPKLNEMTAKIEQMKADTNYRNSMAQRALGELDMQNGISSGRVDVANALSGFTFGLKPAAPATTPQSAAAPATTPQYPSVNLPVSTWNKSSASQSFRDYTNQP